MSKSIDQTAPVADSRPIELADRPTVARVNACLAACEGVEAPKRGELAKLRADLEWMVKKAADNSLDGYRELGAKAAKAEAENARLRAENQELAKLLKEALPPKEDVWWCPSCMAVLPSACVTYSERCETCGTSVAYQTTAWIRQARAVLAQQKERGNE